MNKALLAASLAANLVLAALAFQRLAPFLGFAPAATLNTQPSTLNPASPAAAPASATIAFSQLIGADFNATAANLRAAGFSPKLQRVILAALIAEQNIEKHKALAALIDAMPWWRVTPYGGSNGDPQVTAARRALSREENDLLEQILGPNTEHGARELANAERQFGALPQAKLDAVQRVLSDYAQMMNEIRENERGVRLPEDAEKLAFLDKEQRADLAKLLTPEELLAYDLRSSPVAQQLRSSLSAFNPSEEEYRTLFAINRTLDDKFGSMNALTPDQRRLRAEAEKLLLPQIQAALTPQRWADYQLTTEPNYRQTYDSLVRLQLPTTAVADVVAVRKDLETRASTLRRDNALTPDQRNAQLAALSTEATTRLTPLLGKDGLESYRDNGGYWLQNLVPPPPPPAKK